MLVRLQRDRRLRLRDEIARAAGAPVIASLEAPSVHHPLRAGENFSTAGRVPPPSGPCGMSFTPSERRCSAKGRPSDLVRRRLASPHHRTPTGPVRGSLWNDRPSSSPRTPLCPRTVRSCPSGQRSPERSPWVEDCRSPSGPNDSDDDPPQLLVSIVVFDGESPSSPRPTP